MGDSTLSHEAETRFQKVENALIRVLDHLDLEHVEGDVHEPIPEPVPDITPNKDSKDLLIERQNAEMAALKAQLAEAQKPAEIVPPVVEVPTTEVEQPEHEGSF